MIAFSLVTMPWFQLLVFEQILSEIISVTAGRAATSFPCAEVDRARHVGTCSISQSPTELTFLVFTTTTLNYDNFGRLSGKRRLLIDLI